MRTSTRVPTMMPPQFELTQFGIDWMTLASVPIRLT
jgi:hypothetical protein